MELKQVNSSPVLPAVIAEDNSQANFKNDNFPFDLESEVEEIIQPIDLEDTSSEHFITSNTEPIGLEDLRARCILPVFTKDNENTISHPEFINTVAEIGNSFFAVERMLKPAIRVSHLIKGRVPEAMGKAVVDLMEQEKNSVLRKNGLSD